MRFTAGGATDDEVGDERVAGDGSGAGRRSPRDGEDAARPALSPAKASADAGAARAAGSGIVVRLRPVEPFDNFYRRELSRVLTLARALCGAAHAEDVAQDAMLAAYRHWADVSVMDRPDLWLRRVAVNVATSRLRRRTTEARALLRLSARPVVVAELPERDEVFWAAVRRLPRRQAQVVALYYVDDLGVAAVAELLGLSPGAVKQYLFRARQTLARELGASREVER